MARRSYRFTLVDQEIVVAKTTWMYNPADGQSYAADTPIDMARLRAEGYLDEAPGGAKPAPPQRKTEGVEHPPPAKN